MSPFKGAMADPRSCRRFTINSRPNRKASILWPSDDLGTVHTGWGGRKLFDLESSEEGFVAQRRVPKYLIVGNEFEICVEIFEIRKPSITVGGWLVDLMLPKKVVELLRGLGDEEP